MDRGAWWTAVHRVTQSWTWLKRLSMHACIGEENGNPFQYSCLENPRDRGAWWAAVCGVTQSQTRLKQLATAARRKRKVWLCILASYYSNHFFFFSLHFLWKHNSFSVHFLPSMFHEPSGQSSQAAGIVWCPPFHQRTFINPKSFVIPYLPKSLISRSTSSHDKLCTFISSLMHFLLILWRWSSVITCILLLTSSVDTLCQNTKPMAENETTAE